MENYNRDSIRGMSPKVCLRLTVKVIKNIGRGTEFENQVKITLSKNTLIRNLTEVCFFEIEQLITLVRNLKYKSESFNLELKY